MTIQKTFISNHFFSILILLLVTTSSTFSQIKVEEIDQLLVKYKELQQFNGSALVAHQGKVILKKGYGMANMEWDIPNTPETKHRLGSVTKQFTAMLILQLAAEGKIDLEAPILTYLPDYPQDKAEIITTHNLLTHSSGIPNYTAFPDFFEKKSQTYQSPDDFIKEFQDMALDFEPGERFSYSNSGYFLLGVILEKVSGKTYDALLEEKILQPLNMKDTGYDLHSTILKKRATGYKKRGFDYVNSRYLDMSLPYAAGAMYSTIEDLYKWDQALYTNKLLPQDFMDMYFKKHINVGNEDAYAYGWMVGEQNIGNTTESTKVIGHGGGINGFNTLIKRYPEQKTLVVLLNNTGGAPLNSIAQSILGIVYDKSYDIPKASIAQEMRNIISDDDFNSALVFFKENEDSNNYDFNEDEMNALGYELMGENQYKQASVIFQLNVDRFPNSSNVYDSYAESLMQLGNTQQAISIYKKSLELNRNNQNAIEMLKKLDVDTSEYEKEIIVPEEILKSYVGTYELQPGFNLEIFKNGNQMQVQATGQGIVDIFPKSQTRFYLKIIQAEIEFNKAEDGNIKSLTLFQAGQEMEGKRLEE